jgi:secondary thiamine-phosphate synthase enzyme
VGTTSLCVAVPGRGLHEITREVEELVRRASLREGLATLFLPHTSASLVVQENADPSARRDLEAWLCRLVPDGDPRSTHTAEGPDDMSSHVKAALTATSLSIPIVEGRLALGTWQGIYLWEHRRRGGERRVLVTLLGEGAGAGDAAGPVEEPPHGPRGGRPIR